MGNFPECGLAVAVGKQLRAFMASPALTTLVSPAAHTDQQGSASVTSRPPRICSDVRSEAPSQSIRAAGRSRKMGIRFSNTLEGTDLKANLRRRCRDHLGSRSETDIRIFTTLFLVNLLFIPHVTPQYLAMTSQIALQIYFGILKTNMA